jgi:hypothetical protein
MNVFPPRQPEACCRDRLVRWRSVYRVARDVERNALRAGWVERAEAWRWCRLWRRIAGRPAQQHLLSLWPVPYPKDWVKFVNAPQTEAEVAAIRRCVLRGQPYEREEWIERTAKQLGLARISHERGRTGDSVYHRNPTRKRGSDVTAGSTGRELRTILAYASGYDGGVVRNAG